MLKVLKWRDHMLQICLQGLMSYKRTWRDQKVLVLTPSLWMVIWWRHIVAKLVSQGRVAPPKGGKPLIFSRTRKKASLAQPDPLISDTQIRLMKFELWLSLGDASMSNPIHIEISTSITLVYMRTWDNESTIEPPFVDGYQLSWLA